VDSAGQGASDIAGASKMHGALAARLVRGRLEVNKRPALSVLIEHGYSWLGQVLIDTVAFMQGARRLWAFICSNYSGKLMLRQLIELQLATIICTECPKI